MGQLRPLSMELVPWDDLTPAESRKLQYLLGVKRSLDRLNPDFKTFEFSVALKEGYKVRRTINWHDVGRHCAPDVILVMIGDQERERNQFDFPGYAILPRLEKVVDLSFAESPGEDDRAYRSATDESLTHLRSVAARLGGDAQSSAIKHVDILSRMLRNAD